LRRRRTLETARGDGQQRARSGDLALSPKRPVTGNSCDPLDCPELSDLGPITDGLTSTADSTDRRNSLVKSFGGVSKFKVFLGRSFNLLATALSFACE
jgi:hypothetical protein